ncbi:uncharacterized protein LOC127846397 isoform X2 [Dreissena polymorpha]|uniref:uncharacterized protein LOC127846397 isoform X2 n=1 Tax=Dreissena polymorpha TaxID=45954 RepID=UPI0022654035|nr:uncharacterized protein LOC127846397 isoform X2 [Dreissena polymorpha]
MDAEVNSGNNASKIFQEVLQNNIGIVIEKSDTGTESIVSASQNDKVNETIRETEERTRQCSLCKNFSSVLPEAASLCLGDYTCSQCVEPQFVEDPSSKHSHILKEECNVRQSFDGNTIAPERCLTGAQFAAGKLDETKVNCHEENTRHSQHNKQICVETLEENATQHHALNQNGSYPEHVKRVNVLRPNQVAPTENNVGVHILWCEPCRAQQKTVIARVYCEECDNECLCETCEKHHKIQKSTKQHVLKDINHYINQSTDKLQMCEPCESLRKSSPAFFFCKECEHELLCEECGNQHAYQKSTRDHRLQSISSNVQESNFHQTKQVTMFCEPCQAQEKKNRASVFCEDCDSECLCETCEKHHRSQKFTRDHKLHDISKYTVSAIASISEQQKLFCEPCKAQDTRSPAVFFCKQCDNELLCEPCGKYHTFQKSTKKHILQDVSNYGETEPDYTTDTKLLFCDPCKAQEKDSIASFLCIECDNELFCKPCGKFHSSQKFTRGHHLQDISKCLTNTNATEKKQILCEPCQAQERTNPAFFFCKDCGNEYLCETCGKNHNSQKATRLHTLHAISKFAEGTIFKLLNSQYKFCRRCKAHDKDRIASFFCTECENELLCEACGKHHSLQKLTEGHTLKRINMIAVNVNDGITKQKINCEPCQAQGKVTPASVFCAECDNECLCESCGRYHSSRKATLGHGLQDIIMYLKVAVAKNAEEQKLVCEPCKAQEINTLATVFCVDCDNELLCGPCGKYHNSRKSTRDHYLQDLRLYAEVVENPSSGEVAGAQKFFCELCKGHGKLNPAVFVCSECEHELFCENCGNYHNVHKKFSNHLLQKIDHRQRIIMDSSSDSIEMNTPGRPVASNIGSDTVTLSWTKPGRFKKGDYFQIGCRECNESRWKICHDNIEENSYVLKNLKSKSSLVFRIRAIYCDFESNYSEESDVVTTPSSPASRMVEFSTVCGDKDRLPVSYSVPLNEIRSARNNNGKTRKFEIGSSRTSKYCEKTILLIGETGTGKSTLVDGMANFIMGVNWNDPFRFTMVNLEDEERQKLAISQTEWITSYTMYPQDGGRLKYAINIIDTPGFGDTRGFQRDQEIIEQIRELFSVQPPQGVAIIDAVCFLIKAPDARLTPTQSYIFQSIMSLFGRDIEENICSLITFADGQEPPVIAALKESKLPFGKYFTFNNSALFARNSELDQSSLTPMFWDMGLKSFQNFFHHLDSLHSKSLQLTSNVLNERFRLEATVRNLEPLLDAGLTKINALKSEIQCFEENKAIIADNKDFKYTVQTTKQLKKDLPAGQHVTNCIQCNMTCHENCQIPNNEEKRKCWAMDKKSGNCRICPDNCFWDKHANTPYIFEFIVVDEEKTYAEMKKKYEKATGQLLSQEQLITQMDKELNGVVDLVDDMMETVNECNTRLAVIALRPNPLTITEHIDLLIENEKMVKRNGWFERVKTLQMLRKRAQIVDNVDHFRQQATSCVKVIRKRAKGKNIFKRAWNYFGR